MDQNIQKALWLGISILFFAAVVGIGMMMFSSAKEVTSAGQEQINSTAKTLSKQAFTEYDATEVSGDQVVSAIKQFEDKGGDVQITVTLKTGNTTNYISTGTASSGSLTGKTRAVMTTDKKNMSDISNNAYINPNGNFDAVLVYDSNDNIRGITFTQK